MEKRRTLGKKEEEQNGCFQRQFFELINEGIVELREGAFAIQW